MYHNDIKPLNMMAHKTGNGPTATFKVYLIDIDTARFEVRDWCPATYIYCPGIMGLRGKIFNHRLCNHALDVQMILASFYEILF